MELLHATKPATSYKFPTFFVSTPLINPHPSLFVENVLHAACLIGRRLISFQSQLHCTGRIE
jgi:hypothetical protein